MREKCPRCGSFNIELYPDRSGVCQECERAFIEPIPEDAVIPEKKPIPVGSPDEDPRSAYRTSPEWRRRAAWIEYETGWQPSFGEPTTDLGFSERARKKRERMRIGGFMTIAGSPFFLISIPVVMSIMLTIVSSEVGRTVTLDEFLDALGQTGLASLFYIGIFLQIMFFVVAIVTGIFMMKYAESATIGAVGLGIASIIISFVYLGGIVAAVGGILVLVGGAIGATGGS